MSPPGGVKVTGGRKETRRVSERQDQAGGDGVDDPVGPQTQDLSVPMWVWTLLGFALVVAVIIVVIIWGGGQGRPTDQGTEGQSEMTSTTEPSEAETMPSDVSSAAATQPG